MENVMLSAEQFKELIEAIKPPSLQMPTVPVESQRDRSVALEVLRACEASFWGPETEFIKQVRELAKTKI